LQGGIPLVADERAALVSTPKPLEGISIRVMPLTVFALLLIIPFLNFEFTLYRSTLKLFVFQTAATLLWGWLLWQWAAGRLGREGWPAWWLFAPVALVLAWGVAASAVSPQPWLAAGGLVEGFYGAAGAFGLALLLREAGHRRMFVAAAGAVAFALAFLMLLYYGEPGTRFLGDIDHLPGREAGAAFLLLPTLAAAAALYRLARGDRGEKDYRRTIWMAVLLAVLLLAGLRTRVPAWRYGLGAGLALVAWLMLPRWRLAAVALLVLVGIAVASREAQRGQLAAEYLNPLPAARHAVLDSAERGIVRRASAGRLLAGNGVGAFFLIFDRERPVWTYAVSRADEVIGHARRQLTEVLIERGVVGVALVVVAGLACLVAGVLAYRRARDDLDAALGAGIAAWVVALGVFACFSNGAVGFGSAMVGWVGLGLIGALSVDCARPAALSWSPGEEAYRDEARPRLRGSTVAVALGGGLAVVAAWFALAARPFWAEYCLREGKAEGEACRRFYAQKRLAERTFRQHEAAARQIRKGLEKKLRAAEEALRAAAAAHQKAATSGAPAPELAALASKKQAAAKALGKLRTAVRERFADLDLVLQTSRGAVEASSAEYRDSALRTDAYLRRAAAASLGDRVWLNAEVQRALSDAARDRHKAAATRLERLSRLCGPAFDLDVIRARCYAKLGRPAAAHRHFRRYAARVPFGALCTLFTPRVSYYEDWFRLISDARAKRDPRAAEWAKDFLAAISEGIRWHPEHYGLLLLRGEMFYRLGDKARSRADMLAAVPIIEDALRHITAPLPRATLFFELANANIHWDKGKALKAARQVFLEKVDFRDPQAQQVLLKARQIIKALEPPPGKKPKPPAGPQPPPGKTSPPPKSGAAAPPPARPAGGKK